MSLEVQSCRNLLTQPLWIKDSQYFDLQSLQRSDYQWHLGTSRKAEPEGIRARSFKPKVSAYRSTINWDLGEKSKSVSCVCTESTPETNQNFTSSLTNLLNQQPRDWLIDDYDSKHKEWRRTEQIVKNKEPFTRTSLYREHFSPKEADHVQPVKPVHTPLKTLEKFSDTSVYTHEYTPKPFVVDNKRPKYFKVRLPLEMIPSRPVHKSSAETMGNFVANKDMLKNTTYKEDFQRYVLMNKEPVMCRKIAPTIKMSKVLRPPYEILEASPTSTSSYRMNFTDFMKSHHLSDQLPAAGLTTSGGPIKSQRQTYSFQPLIAKELSKTEESLSKQRHSSVQLSRSLYLPDIVEQIENRWPYLEHKKGCFYSTKQIEGSF